VYCFEDHAYEASGCSEPYKRTTYQRAKYCSTHLHDCRDRCPTKDVRALSVKSARLCNGHDEVDGGCVMENCVPSLCKLRPSKSICMPISPIRGSKHECRERMTINYINKECTYTSSSSQGLRSLCHHKLAAAIAAAEAVQLCTKASQRNGLPRSLLIPVQHRRPRTRNLPNR